MKTLHLCGAGNSEGVRLALRVNEAEGRWDRLVILDDDPDTHGRRLLGVEVVGAFDVLASADPAVDEAVNLVARTTAGRVGAGVRIASFGIPLVGMVAPGVDTLGAELAPDVLIYPGAVVGPEVTIGAGAVVFMGAVVGHESVVGDGCVVAANAVLNARVRLEDRVYVGSAATVLPEITVGEGATVGAGSAVVDDVAAGATVMGVPARALRPVTTGDSARPAAPRPGPDRIGAALAAAWSEVLDGAQVDPGVNVFDLGATSLGALRVSERVGRKLGIDLAVVDLFRFPTVRDLAAHLAGGAVRPARPPARTPSPTPPASPEAGDLTAAVTEVFRTVLGVADIGPESHFFDLGGDPAAAQQACHALQRVTGEPLCFMQVARYPTPRELARHLEAAAGQPPHCPAQGVMSRLIHRHEWQRG